MRNSRAVLFDLDGTLVDSRAGILASVSHALHALGHVPDLSADVSYLLGPPIETVMARALAPYGDERVAEAMEAFRSHQEERGIYSSAVFEGVPELLALLRDEGFRLYVATSKRERLAQIKLAHFGLATHFVGIHGWQPGRGHYHKSDLVRHVLQSEGLAPERTAMVGDRMFDIASALANDVPVIGALWGYGSRDELAEAGATVLAGNPRRIPALLALLLP